MLVHFLRRRALIVWLMFGFCCMLATTATSSPKTASKAQIVPADAKTVMSAVHKSGAKAVLLNIWATWCEPCREEMPDIVRFYRENQQRGLRLVLVSGDSIEEKASAEEFLTAHGIHFQSFIKTGSDMDFIDGIDRRWNGNLPMSMLYDGQGKPVHVWSGKVSFQMLQQKFEHLIQTNQKEIKKRTR